MRISLTDAGKRYNREWIFRHVNRDFETGRRYALTGPNGSGKSTLLQAIAGSLELSEGKWEINSELANSGSANPQIRNSESVNPESAYSLVSLAAPYLELIEEMTATEFLEFHRVFKPFVGGLTTAEILRIVHLDHAAGKQIRYYSSGMKQRMKLAQAILSDTPFVLLDEPCTNLDQNGIALYHQLVEKYTIGRCVVVGSNDPVEYNFCEKVVDMLEFKS